MLYARLTNSTISETESKGLAISALGFSFGLGCTPPGLSIVFAPISLLLPECGVFLGSSTMSLSKSEKQSSNLKPDHSNYVTREELREFDLNNQLAKLALPLAQAWRDNHPNAQPG